MILFLAISFPFPSKFFSNSFQNQWKLAWRALGQFPYGILKEFQSKSMQIGLESSWPISLLNPYGIPIRINANLSGEFLVNSPMESLRNSVQNQWKLVWRALGKFPYGILKEFLSKSMQFGLESSWPISLWNA